MKPATQKHKHKHTPATSSARCNLRPAQQATRLFAALGEWLEARAKSRTQQLTIITALTRPLPFALHQQTMMFFFLFFS